MFSTDNGYGYHIRIRFVLLFIIVVRFLPLSYAVLRIFSLCMQEIITSQVTRCDLTFVHSEDDATVSIETLLSYGKSTIPITAVGSL